MQTPGYVMIMNEMAHDARIIPLDGRPHLDQRLRPWNGDSRGRWEGDTLVVDTTNFSTKSDFMGAHEKLHLTERFTRASADILNYEFTVDDPTTWTAPWTAMIPLKQKDELIYEYACHEGERGDPRHAARPPLRRTRGGREDQVRPEIAGTGDTRRRDNFLQCPAAPAQRS